MFNEYDCVCMSELKHIYPLSIPGFNYLRSRVTPGEDHRGGVGILIKQHLWPEVYDIDISHDQVWFHLQSIPDTVFGAIYIAPRDSPYYQPQSFATIQEHCNRSNVFILGDFNARLGSLEAFNKPENNIHYSHNPDQTINANGRELLLLCENKHLIPVNHLQINQTTCEGGFTFKKKQRWISQLDWVICTEAAAKYVQDFRILQQEQLPTDHAALSLTIRGIQLPASHLLDSAKQLDLYIENEQKTIEKSIHPIHFNNVNHDSLQGNLPEPEHIWHLAMDSDIDTLCNSLTDTIYEATRKSKRVPTRPTGIHTENATDRWNNILNSKDDKQLWKSINWKIPTNQVMQPFVLTLKHY